METGRRDGRQVNGDRTGRQETTNGDRRTKTGDRLETWREGRRQPAAIPPYAWLILVPEGMEKDVVGMLCWDEK